MNYKDLNIERTYVSCGNNGIANAFIIPLLKGAKEYKRSVGFFSSGVIKIIAEGAVALARRKGHIKLIASPKLSENDIQAISLGYKKRSDCILESFAKEFGDQISQVEDENLRLLVDLIASNCLDIKIAVTNTLGDYHDKLGVFIDDYGNKVAFSGSANSSINGYRDNYEKIRVSRSWLNGEKEIVSDEENEFNKLWENNNPFVETYQFNECAKEKLLEVIGCRNNHNNSNTAVELRDYQLEAINAWINNGYKGFYVMATGTGKTWTAIYSAKRLVDNKAATIVICAPYKHLVKQWEEDVKSAFPEAKIIMVSSENSSWESRLNEEIVRKEYYNNQLIIISTITSFGLDRFNRTISKLKGERLLIVDEAHRFNNLKESLHDEYQYMLGLSATPFSGSSSEKGKELMGFFGGQVFNLPIEDALNMGHLVNYTYNPIYLTATEDEERLFNYHSHKIASCFRNGVCIDSDSLVKSLRNRLRVISMSGEKISRISNILDQIQTKDHFVVYCGDGRLFDADTGEEVRHINAIKKAMSEKGYKVSQFTAKENMKERMELVDAFNKGEISALAAIRCLDEGINIPSIKSALILSSNDDYREFVQRRGRILRRYKNKETADIFDVIVLPSSDMQAWAKIELRRFYEYAKLSLNWDKLYAELKNHLDEYGLNMEDIDVFDYDDIEEEMDE